MSTAKELTLPQRVAGLLKSAEREAQLKEMAEKSITITTITNQAGYQQCHAARMVLKNQRIIIEKDGKAARDEANKFRAAVIAEEARLIGLIDPEESRLKAIQDAWDNEQKRIKEAKEEAERQRIAAIQARIARIANSPVGVTGKDATQIKAQLTAIEGIAIDDTFAEFKDAAQTAKDEAVGTLSGMHTERLAFEDAQVRAEEARKQREAEEAAERERIAAERAELERLRAENERLARIEHERQAEASRREREQLDRERQQQEAAAQIERERIAAEAEAARKAHEQREAEAKRVRDAEEARIAAERKALEDARREQEQKVQRELSAKQQAKRDEITGLVAAHYKIKPAEAAKLLHELFS